MSTFHPNEIARRGRAASAVAAGVLLFLAGGFFRSQVLNYQKYALQSETNRLREVPVPIRGVQLAGKTGTAQSGTSVNGKELNHAWFVGFAPAAKPSIVVAVMIEFGGHGTRAAAIASRIIQAYLHATPIVDLTVEG